MPSPLAIGAKVSPASRRRLASARWYFDSLRFRPELDAFGMARLRLGTRRNPEQVRPPIGMKHQLC
jgi:hypothetical protein